MNTDHIELNAGSTTFAGYDAVTLYRVMHIRSAIGLHAKCGLIPTRGVTITKLFGLASGYTGKRYKRGEHDKAIADLTIWIDNMKMALPVVDNR